MFIASRQTIDLSTRKVVFPGHRFRMEMWKLKLTMFGKYHQNTNYPKGNTKNEEHHRSTWSRSSSIFVYKQNKCSWLIQYATHNVWACSTLTHLLNNHMIYHIIYAYYIYIYINHKILNTMSKLYQNLRPSGWEIFAMIFYHFPFRFRLPIHSNRVEPLNQGSSRYREKSGRIIPYERTCCTQIALKLIAEAPENGCLEIVGRWFISFWDRANWQVRTDSFRECIEIA